MRLIFALIAISYLCFTTAQYVAGDYGTLGGAAGLTAGSTNNINPLNVAQVNPLINPQLQQWPQAFNANPLLNNQQQFQPSVDWLQQALLTSNNLNNPAGMAVLNPLLSSHATAATNPLLSTPATLGIDNTNNWNQLINNPLMNPSALTAAAVASAAMNNINNNGALNQMQQTYGRPSLPLWNQQSLLSASSAITPNLINQQTLPLTQSTLLNPLTSVPSWPVQQQIVSAHPLQQPIHQQQAQSYQPQTIQTSLPQLQQQTIQPIQATQQQPQQSQLQLPSQQPQQQQQLSVASLFPNAPTPSAQQYTMQWQQQQYQRLLQQVQPTIAGVNHNNQLLNANTQFYTQAEPVYNTDAPYAQQCSLTDIKCQVQQVCSVCSTDPNNSICPACNQVQNCGSTPCLMQSACLVCTVAAQKNVAVIPGICRQLPACPSILQQAILVGIDMSQPALPSSVDRSQTIPSPINELIKQANITADELLTPPANEPLSCADRDIRCQFFKTCYTCYQDLAKPHCVNCLQLLECDDTNCQVQQTSEICTAVSQLKQYVPTSCSMIGALLLTSQDPNLTNNVNNVNLANPLPAASLLNQTPRMNNLPFVPPAPIDNVNPASNVATPATTAAAATSADQIMYARPQSVYRQQPNTYMNSNNNNNANNNNNNMQGSSSGVAYRPRYH